MSAAESIPDGKLEAGEAILGGLLEGALEAANKNKFLKCPLFLNLSQFCTYYTLSILNICMSFSSLLL